MLTKQIMVPQRVPLIVAAFEWHTGALDYQRQILAARPCANCGGLIGRRRCGVVTEPDGGVVLLCEGCGVLAEGAVQ